MASGSPWRPVLASLAPPLLPDESVSSWLFRLADAHLLTRDELAHELGGDPAAIERGHVDCLDQVAAVTNVPEERLVKAVHPDLIVKSMPFFRLGREAIVCFDCLLKDRDAGRVPYVRVAWTHPLAVVCNIHGHVLMPCSYPFSYHMERKGHISNDPFKAGNAPYVAGLRIRLEALLSCIAAKGRTPENLAVLGRLRAVIGDVVDALRTETKPNMPPLMRMFNRRLMQLGPQSTQFLISDGLADLEPFDRVKHVLLALTVISEPVGSGLVAEIAQEELDAEPGTRLDPLVLLADSLKERDIAEFDLRVAEWPQSLRERWEKAKADAQTE